MVPVGCLPGCGFPQQCWILPVSPLVHGVLLVVLEVLLGNALGQPLGTAVPGSGEEHGYPCECCRNEESWSTNDLAVDPVCSSLRWSGLCISMLSHK